jgi:Chalcone isomerase like
MLRRVLVSAVPRQIKPHHSCVSNVSKPRPSRLRSFALGAALALSASAGIAHLDSNVLADKEPTVGTVLLCNSQFFFTQPLPVDPATSIEFPAVLRIPSKGTLPPFTLIGVGVRVVSFLKIKVYSVAFYADLSNPNLKVTFYPPVIAIVS